MNSGIDEATPSRPLIVELPGFFLAGKAAVAEEHVDGDEIAKSTALDIAQGLGNSLVEAVVKSDVQSAVALLQQTFRFNQVAPHRLFKQDQSASLQGFPGGGHGRVMRKRDHDPVRPRLQQLIKAAEGNAAEIAHASLAQSTIRVVDSAQRHWLALTCKLADCSQTFFSDESCTNHRDPDHSTLLSFHKSFCVRAWSLFRCFVHVSRTCTKHPENPQLVEVINAFAKAVGSSMPTVVRT